MSSRKRVVIAFSLEADTERLTILGIFYGGQGYESSLNEPVE